ncbi:methyltransferase [Lysinibacillus antri]|uniref:Class I SAM-dependent methyltransferase n=1 Tax=Lysinibacillus antri TaxID=2498145 RepID=A0A3S0R572_9BACI|nr:methyltransferase [Lysinibacillus antri]RUL49874.1 class I SAM-dependent methyltransferase [Lysinibacillus antri]
MNEHYYDELFAINTMGHKSEVNNSVYYHPYEPTPYSALEELCKHYEVVASDHIVDFGCGKGRLNFFLNYKFHASCVGVEMNPDFFDEALQNEALYRKKIKKLKGDITFHNCLAEKYAIQPCENKFYYFNPFSVQVFIKVVHNILRSFEETKRNIDLILYYPSDDYRYFLDIQTSFELLKEVPLPGLVEKNINERFLIYRIG